MFTINIHLAVITEPEDVHTLKSISVTSLMICPSVIPLTKQTELYMNGLDIPTPLNQFSHSISENIWRMLLFFSPLVFTAQWIASHAYIQGLYYSSLKDSRKNRHFITAHCFKPQVFNPQSTSICSIYDKLKYLNDIIVKQRSGP